MFLEKYRSTWRSPQEQQISRSYPSWAESFEELKCAQTDQRRERVSDSWVAKYQQWLSQELRKHSQTYFEWKTASQSQCLSSSDQCSDVQFIKVRGSRCSVIALAHVVRRQSILKSFKQIFAIKLAKAVISSLSIKERSLSLSHHPVYQQHRQ